MSPRPRLLVVAHPADSVSLGLIEADLMARWPESHIAPGLERISALAGLLGDPQRAYPLIHLTGTNGKTSTARMIEALLLGFGLRPGLYTSPHLHSFLERIRIAGEPVAPERFIEVYSDVAPLMAMVDEQSQAAGGPRMTFFEAMTGLAYAVFADAPVDVAIVEVGVGGEWDATNIADGVVSVVTPIDMDHADLLGDTIEKIAHTKAGIIKEGAIAVLAGQRPEVARVLLERCAQVGATPVRQGVEFGLIDRQVAVGGQMISLQGLGGKYDQIFLALHGEHQAHNAAIALAAVESFLGGGRGSLDIEVVREAFASVTSPGRMEIVRRSPTIMVDAAHNPHGAAALAAALSESFSFEHLVGVLAVFADKDARGLLQALEPVLHEVVITRNSSPRCMPVNELAELAYSIFGEERVREEEDFAAALDLAAHMADESVGSGGGAGVVVTGSVVTAAQARALLGRITP